jgi:hypothetical protein
MGKSKNSLNYQGLAGVWLGIKNNPAEVETIFLALFFQNDSPPLARSLVRQAAPFSDWPGGRRRVANKEKRRKHRKIIVEK